MWLLIVAIVGLAAAGLAWRVHVVRTNAAAEAGGRHGGGHGGAGGGAHDLPVVVATARRGDLPVYLYGLGTVTPLKTVDLRSRVDGAITEIHYTEDQRVKVGDFLLQIDPRPYQATLDQAKGQLVKDQATLSSANWNVQQDQQALQSKAIAEQQLHTDTATRDNTQGAIDVDRANIAAAQVNLDYCHITSPIDGVIGLRQVDVGNIVHAADSTSLAVITQERPITVVFHLAETYVDAVRKRMRTGKPVTVDAYDAGGDVRLARGTVLAIDNQIDATTGTFAVKAQFANDDRVLYPSQFVNAYLLVDTVDGATIVPAAAIQHDAAGAAFVYVVGADDAVKMAKVTVPDGDLLNAERGEEDVTAVTAGLSPGDVVVTDGVDKLTDGTKVSPRPEPSTRPTTGPTRAAEGPTDETNVTGPAMDRPDAGGRPNASGDATTRPFTAGGHHHRHE